jgi:hypothetical protein
MVASSLRSAAACSGEALTFFVLPASCEPLSLL